MAKTLTIIGHRGAAGLAEENSLESIRLAMKHKVDMIELDLRLKNSVVILSHNIPLANTIPCPLKQALQEVNGKITLNLEIKRKSVIQKLPNLLKEYNGKIIFSSSNYAILKEVKSVLPQYDIAVVENWSSLRAVAESVLLDTNRIHIQHKWLWSGIVKSLKKQGYNLYAYTVNDADRASELASWGVDGIFTDYPDRFN